MSTMTKIAKAATPSPIYLPKNFIACFIIYDGTTMSKNGTKNKKVIPTTEVPESKSMSTGTRFPV